MAKGVGTTIKQNTWQKGPYNIKIEYMAKGPYNIKIEYMAKGSVQQ